MPPITYTLIRNVLERRKQWRSLYPPDYVERHFHISNRELDALIEFAEAHEPAKTAQTPGETPQKGHWIRPIGDKGDETAPEWIPDHQCPEYDRDATRKLEQEIEESRDNRFRGWHSAAPAPQAGKDEKP